MQPTTSTRFDVERLLSPISPRNPSGEDLRHEGTYDRIRELRQSDDPDLPQGVWKTALRKADWNAVEKECLNALESRSKDLNLSVWLTEAWLHMYGFRGLRDGLNVCIELCETFWDTLYPEPREGDWEFRFSPFEWMDQKMIVPVKLIPITNPANDGATAYCMADWEQSSRPEARQQQRGQQDTGGVTQARFQQSMVLTSTQWLLAEATELREALKSLEVLVQCVEDRCPDELPPTLSNLRRVLESILYLLSSFLNERGDLPESSEEREEHEDFSSTDAPLLPGPISRIRTRAEAYQRLAEAADFLVRTEPHSPVPYLVKRAISWGSLSLGELLPELVRGSGELGEIVRLLQLDQNGRRTEQD